MKDVDIPDFDRVPGSPLTPKVYILSDLPEHRTLINPEIDEETRRKVENTSIEVLKNPPEPAKETESSWLASFLNSLAQPATYFFGGAALLYSAAAEDMALGGAGALSTLAVMTVMEHRRPPVVSISTDHAGKVYLRTEWLEGKLHSHLLEAEAAVISVRNSLVAEKDLIDKARIDACFPQMVWDIAATLFDISSARKEIEGVPGTRAQQKALIKVERMILQRIRALKTCAAAVKLADDQYRNLLAIERMEGSGVNSRITDLLARTAVHDMEMAEIQAMSAQAKATTLACKEAIDTALDSINETLALS